MKTKVSELRKENQELEEQVAQLEEDTEDGIEMYNMVRERENKLKKEIQEN